MKNRVLVSCILLSILILLLLSSAAQATEYREVNKEVKAEDILKQIENGEDVNYRDCLIVGELNASKIKLKTTANPKYDKFLNEGYTTEDLAFFGIHENIRIVESNIKIKNSIFENGFNFSSITFNDSTDFTGSAFNDHADFTGSTFNDSADFIGSTFNCPAYFSISTFNNSVYFLGSTFNSSADFTLSTFNDPAYFLGSTFNDSYFISSTFNDSFDSDGSTFRNSTDFTGSTFRNSTDFTGSTFSSSAYFTESTFKNSTDFTESTFNDSADFIGSTFNDPVYFTESTFKDTIDFTGSSFNDIANFSGSTFNDPANFSGSTFNDPVDFHGSTFDAPPDFDGSTFYDPVNFSETAFNFLGDLNGPKKFKKIITSNEKICNCFRTYYKNEGQLVNADNIYYDYRKFTQDSEKLTSLSKWSDFLSWITCGYGLRPLRTLYAGGFVVGFFAFLYWRGQGIYRSSDSDEKKSKVSSLDALLFSIREFTTLGSVDWCPKDNFRILVTLEGLLGWVMLGIFMATLTNVMIRS